VLGDWLFSLILALAIPAYALALGRRIARPLLDPEANADHVGEALAALGLGLGTLSLATLGLGFLRLYYGPLFLALWLALTVWLRPELRRIWRQAAHRSARWLRAGMPSAPTLPQRLALLVLLLTVPSVLLRTAAPVTEWDAVIYHLASLKLYLAAHAIIPIPDLPLANNPSGAEMLLLPSLMAGAGGVGKLFNLVCALLMGLAIHNLGRRYLGASSAWIGVLLFFSPLWLQLVLPLTLTDFASSLLGLLAAVVVAAIRLAGVVLVSAFLVIPAAAGRIVGRSLGGVVGWAMTAGVVGVLLGFVVAHALEWPEGAAIVIVLAFLLSLSVAVKRLRR